MGDRPEFLAGAAEPVLSKRLQARKANVVNEASSTAAGSALFQRAGPPGESEPLRIMPSIMRRWPVRPASGFGALRGAPKTLSPAPMATTEHTAIGVSLARFASYGAAPV